MPIVRYDDIAAMHVKKVFTWYHICLAILTCYTIILPLLFLYAGSNHKLEITLKSGAKTSVCASNKNVMNNFATELNQRIIKNAVILFWFKKKDVSHFIEIRLFSRHSQIPM